ncbi:MAG: transcriptional regulator, MarR family [Microbacteriaceae bacterium]|jgi:DNA-binding MarR family transcriptional regulator|nr:transcriptional regulator, MarR family [Microbacteriaceae bacterium]
MKDFDEKEDRLWRNLMRLNGALPRLLEEDLVRGAGLSLSEFAILLVLTEAGAAGRRMSDLAYAGRLSPSRATRVVAELEHRGLVEKSQSESDARGNVAVATAAGRKAFRSAYPIQVNRAREILFDHLTPTEVAGLADALSELLRRVSAAER